METKQFSYNEYVAMWEDIEVFQRRKSAYLTL